MRSFRTTLSAIVMVSSVIFVPSEAPANEIRQVPRMDVCKSLQEEWCIAEIHAVDGQGVRHKARPSGRYFPFYDWNWTSYQSVIVGSGPEFVFDSLEFESGIKRVMMQSFYFPKETKYCPSSLNCRDGMEGLQMYLEPSSIDKQREIKVTNDRLPGFCPSDGVECSFGNVPWRLGEEKSFEVVFQVSPTFSPIYASGRTSNLDVSLVSGAGSPLTAARVIIKFTPITLEQTDFTRPNPQFAERALYSTDQPTIFVSGPNNFIARQFLRGCTFWGDLTIASNAMGIGQPVWSSNDETIDVVLNTPHLATDGTKTKGYLEVRIPNPLAYCLWGIDTNNLVGGQVSMLYEGETNPQILTVSTTKSADEFKLISSGFHFSSPTAKIKMVSTTKTEEPAVVAPPKPVEAIETKPAVEKKSQSTRSCFKGKKKVIVTSKRCPKGYSIRN